MNRTATILTNEKCFLGTINIKNYDCIKGINEIVKKNTILFFAKVPLFRDFDMSLFYSRYFNFFVFMKFEPGDYLLKEKEEVTHLFILKKGEYEISFRKNLEELNENIKKLGGVNKHNYIHENNLGSGFNDKQMKKRQMTKVSIL